MFRPFHVLAGAAVLMVQSLVQANALIDCVYCLKVRIALLAD